MTCETCGEKPKKCGNCNKDFPRAVIEIDNPEQITLMRRVVIPASMGDDTTVPPVVGKYHNVLLYYEANQKSYLYSSDGIPTQLVNGLTDYEAAINLPQINGNTLIGDKTGEELGLQDKLTAGDNITIENNVISATDTTYGPATDTEIGLVKPGNGLEVDTDGALSISDIEQYAHFFDTVADMKVADLTDGDYARTLGYYSKNDMGGAYYKISSTNSNEHYETLSNGLYAVLIIEGDVNVNQFGAYGDGTHDDSAAIQAAVSYINTKAIVFEQANPNPNWHRYFSTALTLYFPSSQYLMSDTIEFSGNRYYSIKGNKSIIKCPNSFTGPVFLFSGSAGTKCDIRNFMFREMANAIEYDATNNDLSHVLIENCDFVGITDIAIKYNNRSSMLKIKNCNFSWCYKIFVNIACDNAEFENCWFSEYEANENGYVSFRLLWGENKFINCFFIPNGGYNTGVDQSTLTELAWIEAGDNTAAVANNPKILLDRCRVSAELNAKTLINWKVVPSTGNNPTDTYIRILNCHAMSCTLGATIILAWHLPQQVVFENTEISNEAGTFIKFVDGFDVKTEIGTYFSGANRLLYTYNYGFKNVKTQTNTAWKGIPAELAPFVKYSDNDVRLPVTNSNKTVEFFLGDTNLGSPYGFSKVYLVKGYFFATTSLSSLSSVTGLLMFDTVNSQVETTNAVRVKFVKLAQYAGGTPTSSAADINITPTFNDTNSNILTMSSHQNVTVKLTIDNTVQNAGEPLGEAYISIKEI